MGICLCIPIVAVVGLSIGDGVAEVEEDRPASEVGCPGWEIALHVEPDVSGGDRGADETIGVRKSFSWVGLHGGIAVVGVKDDLAAP